MKRMLMVGLLALVLIGCAVERTVYVRPDGTTEKVVTTPVPVVIETTPVVYYEPYEPSPIIWVDIHGGRHYRGHHGGYHRR